MNLDNDFVIRMPDVRAAFMCSRGARKFFDLHGLDWSGFLKDGIKASELLATKDYLAFQLVEKTRGRK